MDGSWRMDGDRRGGDTCALVQPRLRSLRRPRSYLDQGLLDPLHEPMTLDTSGLRLQSGEPKWSALSMEPHYGRSKRTGLSKDTSDSD